MNEGTPNGGELSGLAVVIPCHNERESVLRCVASLARDIELGCKIFVVDDGSTDGVAEAVAHLAPSVNVSRGDGSLWWSGAVNLGIEVAIEHGSSIIALLNNDCVLSGDDLSVLVRRCRSDPRLILSPAIVDLANDRSVSFGGRIGGRGVEYWTTCPPLDSAGLASVDWLPGHLMVADFRVFRALGLFDNRAFAHYWADVDFSLRAARLGYRLAVDTSVHVANDRSQTGLLLAYPIRLNNVWKMLTSRRSYLRVDEALRFWWRHRSVVQGSGMIRRYGGIFRGIGRQVLEPLHLTSAAPSSDAQNRTR